MLWMDFDEKGYKWAIREEARNEYLISQVCKKLAKGYSVESIADALEEDPARIQAIVDVVTPFAPEYPIEKIMSELPTNV